MEFFYRTEDIKPEDVLEYFVETAEDRAIVNALKGRNPVVLIGSRGVGKSFLLRVAEAELTAEFSTNRVFPVYLTFSRSSLIQTNDPIQFQHWMLARICDRVVRSLSKAGLVPMPSSGLSILAGGQVSIAGIEHTKISEIVDSYETSWKTPGQAVDPSAIPTVERFADAIEELCSQLKIKRFSIFIDEAAHILLSEQQRQFFTLFRDLRSPYLTCNAAIYPGVTAFGDTFQAAHDATLLYVNRNVLATDYVANMREIVEKQADSSLLRNIAENGQNFAVIAYAASGNPRLLLKTLGRAPKVNSQQINEMIREFYRTEIWSEHSGLADKFVGHRGLVDWGRRFIERDVLPDLQSKNRQYLEAEKNSTCFLWIHRDAPQVVKEAIRLLAYTGIVTEHATGIRATRSSVGTRYMVNLGCLLALESHPASTGFQIAKSLTVKRMTEFGASHSAYQDLLREVPKFDEPNMAEVLRRQLEKSVDVLDIREWMKAGLKNLGIATIGGVLTSREEVFRQIYYVGPVRSRQIANTALASVFEYLSG